MIAGGLWNALVDETQVENALLNLAINARDAMGGHENSRLRRAMLTWEVTDIRASNLMWSRAVCYDRRY